jgi:hypothetical protein
MTPNNIDMYPPLKVLPGDGCFSKISSGPSLTDMRLTTKDTKSHIPHREFFVPFVPFVVEKVFPALPMTRSLVTPP